MKMSGTGAILTARVIESHLVVADRILTDITDMNTFAEMKTQRFHPLYPLKKTEGRSTANEKTAAPHETFNA